jgi:cation diffusion facilitator family transporter
LVALVLAGFGWHQVDPWFGLGIAVYILWSAVHIARESFAVLMDEELPTDVSQHMLELACSVPGVLGAHDLRTRISGNQWFVQLHLELPGELTLSVAHGISDQAADAIHAAYPRAEVLVHADPQEVVKAAQVQ